MKKYDKKDVQELVYYEHYEFIPHLFSELYIAPDIDRELVSDVTLHNLCKSDGEYEIIEGQYEESYILMRNNGKMPLSLTIEQFNTLDLGYYSWIEYGEYNSDENKLDVYYYDAECIEGVETLFELPYFKRYLSILEGYLNQKGLINELSITTDNIVVIEEFNEWFNLEYKKYSSITEFINSLV